MKCLFIILGISLFLGSCTVNRKDIISAADRFEKSFKHNNLKQLKRFYRYNIDSISQSELEIVKKIQNFYNENQLVKVEVATELCSVCAYNSVVR